ncbi:hypothetical protein G3D33_000982 [Salmonella enterica subsp. salamae]|nr:hypothetical protein [Salmonella enterica subsp. salamae]
MKSLASPLTMWSLKRKHCCNPYYGIKRVASATRFFIGRYIYFFSNKVLFVIFITILILYYLLHL